MKKVINISIARTTFVIEEDAHALLNDYLLSIKKYFNSDSESFEIITDIESGIAEKLIESTKKTEDAISIEIVRDIILQIGRVEDISKTDWEDPKTSNGKKSGGEEARISRQLFRSSDDVIIAGVASGIASYFSIDPVFIRLAFVLLSMFNGVGVLAYLLLWLMVPVAETTTEKYQMRGEKVTLSNIVDRIQVEVKRLSLQDSPNTQSFWISFITVTDKIFRVVGKGVRFFFKFVLGLVGSVLAGVGLLVSLGLVFVAIWIIFLASSSHVDPITFTLISEMKGSITGLVLIVSSFLVILGPAVLVMMGGLSVLGRRNYLNSPLIFSFGVGWVISCAVAALTLFVLFPSFNDIVAQSPNTKVVEERLWHDMSIDGVPEEVLVGGNVEFRLLEGDKVSLRIFAGEHELRDIHVSKKGSSLSVDHDSRFRVCLFCSTEEPYVVELHAPNVKNLEAGGRGSIMIDGGYGDNFEISVSGSFKVSAKELNLSSINITAIGSHDIVLTGTTTKAVFDMGGSSTLYAIGLNTKIVSINARGANSVYLNPNKVLSGTLTGANNVYYSDNEGLSVEIERFPEGSNSVDIME